MNRIQGLLALTFCSILSTACGSPAQSSEGTTSSAMKAGRTSDAQECWSNADCGDLQFCSTEGTAAGMCGGRGVCANRGITLMCSFVDVGACGCDGNPYPNPCIAHKAGVSINPQPFNDTNVDGDTLAEQPWTDASQTFFYTFTGNGTQTNDSGTFVMNDEPACTRTTPRCEIMIQPKKGTFQTFGSFVELDYDNGDVAFFDAQTDCHNKWQLVGDDNGQTLTLTVSTIQP